MSHILTKYRTFLFYLSFLFFAFSAQAQDKDIKEVVKTADILFEQKKYGEAKDLFSQLVSLYPKDENYNYKFGACLLFVESDKTTPIKFLEYAVSRPNVDPAAFYFLGKGYHYNYRFDEAIVYLNKYKNKLDPKSKNQYPVDQDIRFCENGKGLLINISSPHVDSKKKVQTSDFFMSYKLSSIGGRILLAPSELQSSYDKSVNYTPIMYRASGKDEIYFSSYGSNGKTGLDIYVVRINSEGNLEKPVRLPPTINTKFDDAFPFISDDETEFYFASKGHNSMGGYDIFKSTPNTASQTYSTPINLDYSINTPDDDFMYAIDRNEGYAFFSSSRNCEYDKTYVYKVDASRENYKIAILSGVFDSKDTRSCKITVEDLNTHLEVGSFSTDKKNGEYLMRLQNGGSYSFLVEPFGSNVAYKGRVDLPNLGEMKLLKQEIEIVAENDNEKLIIRNLFEELPASGDDALMAKVLMQDADIEEYVEPKITISSAEMVKELEKSKQTIEQKIVALSKSAALSYGIAMEKREVAQRDLAMADQLEAQTSLNDNSEESGQKQKELDLLMSDAKQHSLEAESAFMVGKDLEKLAESTQKELNKAEGYLIRIQTSVSEGNNQKAEELYKGYMASSPSVDKSTIQNYLASELKKEEAKSTSSLKRADNVANEQEELSAAISQKKAEKNATKKKKTKEEIQIQIDALEEGVAPLAEDKDRYYKEAKVHETAAQEIERKIVAVSDLEEKEEESNVSIPDISAEQKSALITSIVATNQEIEALEGAKTDEVQVLNAGSEELASNTEESSVDSENGTNETDPINGTEQVAVNSDTNSNTSSELAIEENTVVLVENEEPVESTEQLAEGSDPKEGVESEGGGSVIPGGGIVEGAEQTAVIVAATGVEAGSGTEPEESVSEAEESVVEPEEEYYAYTDTYEEESTDQIIVSGASIPKVITDNTGKKKYKTEDLQNAEIILSTSSYNQRFEGDVQENLEETNAQEKALNNQKINYEWVVAIEKEIAEIKYAASKSTNSSYKYNMNSKVTELNEQANQKRNFMKLNAQIINQLENQDQTALNNPSNNEEESNDTEEEGNSESESQIAEPQESIAVNEEEGTTQTGVENSEITIENTEVENTEVENENEVANNTTNDLEGEGSPNQVETATEGESELASVAQIQEEQGINTEDESAEITEISTTENEENVVETEVDEQEASRVAEKEKTQNLEELSVAKASLVQEISNPQPVQIFPSETAVAAVEEQKVKQAEVVKVAGSDLSSLQNELEITKKKKTKRAIAAQIKVKEAEVEYEKKRLILLNQKSKNVVLAQDSMMSNPLSERPSVAKYEEAVKIRKQYAQLESEKSDLEFTLSETKKKKKRRVIEAEIENVTHEMNLSQIEAEIALETAKEMEKVEVATLKKSTKYGQEEMVKLPSVPRELTIEEKQATEELSDYKEYSDVKVSSERKIKEADVMYAKAELKKVEAQRVNDELALLIALAEDLPLAEQDSVLEIIEFKTIERKRIIQEADVQYQEAVVLTNEAYFELNEANSEILTLDNGDEKMQILALIGGNMAPVEVVYDSTNINEIPAELNNDIFVDSDSTFYSSENPIPVDVKLPSGVILKVQIGAFRNPINQETFKGFAPIVGEKTASGLTRYTAGMFKDFETANGAKDGIRAKGYSDAFVVAYLDGKRISISEARRILSGELTADRVGATPAQAVPLNDVTFNVQTVESEVVAQNNPQVTVEQAATRGDLFFTVQVGVYSSRIAPGTVFTITPLNSESIANGLVRYSSGVYGSLAEAITARNRIVRGGISDAFVTAYRNGSRITIAEAKSLGTNSAPFTQQPIEQEPTGQTPQDNTQVSESEATYYIAVGPYTGNIPIEQAQALLSLSSFGVIVEKNNGATLYKIGNFTSVNEANKVRNELVSKGLTNPEVKESEVQ